LPYGDTRRYADVTKIEKGLVEFTYKKVSKVDTQVTRWVNENQGEGWREVGAEHTLFEPIILDVVYNDDGTRTVTYKYEDDSLPMEFTVTQRLSDYMTTSIEGANLSCTGLGRGVTEQVDTHKSGEGMNNAHLIANWFHGSGYRESLNLVSTSASFNQNAMRGVEDDIAALADEVGAASFDMTVTVEWGDFLDDQANTETEEQIKQRVQQTVEAGQEASVTQRIEGFIVENRSRMQRAAKRCEKVEYKVDYKNVSGNIIHTEVFPPIGPDDEWEVQ
jgi:hypothetical protein